MFKLGSTSILLPSLLMFAVSPGNVFAKSTFTCADVRDGITTTVMNNLSCDNNDGQKHPIVLVKVKDSGKVSKIQLDTKEKSKTSDLGKKNKRYSGIQVPDDQDLVYLEDLSEKYAQCYALVPKRIGDDAESFEFTVVDETNENMSPENVYGMSKTEYHCRKCVEIPR